jgi:hypothetical protein
VSSGATRTPMRTTTRAVIVLLLLLAHATGSLASMPAAQGQQPATDAPRAVQLTVVGIDSVVGAGVASDTVRWRLLIENTTDEVWGEVRVRADLHAPIGSRSALRAALAGGAVPPLLRRVDLDASPTALDPGGIALGVGELPLTGLRIGGGVADVLPLRLQILADGVEVGRIDTAVLLLTTTTPTRVATSVVWSVDAPPTRAADGTVAAALDPLTLPGGRLDTLVRTIGRGPADVVTLAPSVTLLEDLALRERERAGGDTAGTDIDPGATRAAELRELLVSTVRLGASPPVALPYADADLARILASPPPVRRLAATAMFEGSRRLGELTGRSSGPVTLLEGAVGPRTLDLVAGSVVLLPYGSIEAPDLALDLPLPEPVRPLVASSGRLLSGVVADPFVTAAIGAGARADFDAAGSAAPTSDGTGAPVQGGPVLAAHHVLLRTAMFYAEAPNRAGRSLLVLPPPDLDPDPRFLITLLDGFAAAPWLDLQGPAGLVRSPETADVTLAPSGAIVLRAASADPLAPRLVQAIADVGAARALLLDAIDADGPGGEPDELVVAGRDLAAVADELLRATSRADLTVSTEDPAVRLETIAVALRASLGELSVTSREVTLTARDGVLPLTLRHTGGVPLRLVVDVIGPAALSWPDGSQRRLTLAADEERTLELPVRAGSTGTFPVVVRVSSPGGTLLVDETLSVRATAVAGPALAGIGAVVAVLLVIGTIRQRRRSRRAHPSVAA